MASLLKTRGYTTACIGKWHLGMDWVDGKPGSEKEVPIGAKMTGGPNALGFDYFCGFTHARNIGTIIEQDRVIAHVEPDENQPLMAKKAVEWLDQRKAGEPFFLYYPLGIPHEPIVPSAEFAGKSAAGDYGDFVEQIDASLGQLMDALKENGLDIDISKLRAEDLDELVQHLRDLTVDVQGNGTVARHAARSAPGRGDGDQAVGVLGR